MLLMTKIAIEIQGALRTIIMKISESTKNPEMKDWSNSSKPNGKIQKWFWITAKQDDFETLPE